MEAAGTLAPKFDVEVIIYNEKIKILEGNPKSVIGVAEFKSVTEAECFLQFDSIYSRQAISYCINRRVGIAYCFITTVKCYFGKNPQMMLEWFDIHMKKYY